MAPIQQVTPPPEKTEALAVTSDHIAGNKPPKPATPDPNPVDARPHFDQLPVEILSLIASALHDDHEATKTLRRVSKRCASVCTRLVFQNLTLLLRQQSINRLNQLLDNPELCSEVSHLTINTAEYTDTRLNTWDWDDRDAGLLRSFLAVLTKLGRLQKLRSVKLRCSHEVVGPQQRRRWWARNVPENTVFRREVLRSVFAGLNDPAHPTPNLDTLCIENLQDCSNNAVVGSDDFKAVMSRIRRLDLQIATEDVDGNGSVPANLEKNESHEFFGEDLAKHWLEPVCDQLTHLKLYSRDMYFGYLPKCRLPVFPALKSLVLGGMSFSHDTQMDWLLAHGATLQDLILDNCPILIGVRIPTALTPDHYPATPQNTCSARLTGPRSWSSYLYPARWNEYFIRIATGLPQLKSLRCGFGDWYEGKAFDSSSALGTGLWAQRYRIFDDGEWRKPPFTGGAYDGTWSDPPLYPECTEEDWKALCEVKRCIQQRLGVSGED